jgi:hypothetical protein
MEKIRQESQIRQHLRFIVAPVAASLLLSATGCSAPEREELPSGAVVLDMSHQSDELRTSDSLYFDLDDIGLANTEAGEQPEATIEAQSDHARALDSYGVLATIELQGDDVVFVDQSPTGISDDVKEWFQDSVETHGQIIETAFRSGSLNALHIGVEKDFDKEQYESDDGDKQALVHGFFEDASNTAAVNFTPNNPKTLDRATTDQFILHEVLHSLFKNSSVSAFNNNAIPKNTLQDFVSACTTFRSVAAKDFNESSYQFAGPVNTLALIDLDPIMQERFEKVAIAMAEGTAVKPEYPYVTTGDNDLNECYFPSLGHIGRQIATEQGLSLQRSSNATPQFSLESGEQYYNIQKNIVEFLTEDTLYKVLTESSYLNGEFDRMGHPYEGIDELAASTLNILLSFPTTYAENIRALDSDEQDAIIDMTRLLIDETVRTNPELRELLVEREAQLLDAIRQ